MRAKALRVPTALAQHPDRTLDGGAALLLAELAMRISCGSDDACRVVTRQELQVIVAAVRPAVTTGAAEDGVLLARRLWATAEAIGLDADCADELAAAGAAAAAAARDPQSLGELLRSTSLWFQQHGDLIKAEKWATSEWEVWRRLGQTSLMAECLWRRADMFVVRGRGERELGCYERLESLYQGSDASARADLVRVVAAKGIALLAYGNVEAGLVLLSRADKMVRTSPDFPPVEQAAVVEWTGRALWACGKTGTARRRFVAALALLVDHDDTAADRVRQLLAHDQSSELLPMSAPSRRLSGLGSQQ
ncbi:hypothetical protein [Umezawaea sp. Da 62-37]|uniref:hypothetical protein n=1 Tax=Umezawaea sp. Da 62-37 TaxID=3075927 RepID=UPI0028F7448D|nr:hypothetical protein [Umezawaea sp. Da 62-37]WNV83049.1 hypothetical protein RM788_33325 [Umezawaea sp. Da 62-37]